MDKDRIKGKIEDMGGRAERQIGEWTGDEKKQAEGAKHQVKGKVRNIAGQVKDAGREAMKDISREQHKPEVERDRDRDRDLDGEKGAA